MPPLCIVFDLDDTLYLERDYVRSGFAAVAKWADVELGIADFEARTWRLFNEGHRQGTFQIALTELGIENSRELLPQMIALYRAHRPSIELLPDSISCLTGLRQCAVLGLITDGDPQRQRLKCEALGVVNWLDHTIYTGDWGAEFHKPHPRAYEEIQSRVGSGYHFVYVADNPVKDFTSPFRLGWDTIRVRRPGSLHFHAECDQNTLPRAEISSLANFSEVLSRCLSCPMPVECCR
jgi:putative hydrolase of the HAD superfamily